MSDRRYHFSRDEDQSQLAITPLGAAIVEALPDRKAVAKIKRDFKRRRSCPASKLFTAEAAATWAAAAAAAGGKP